MPIIKPISEMKNYTSVVNEVSYGNRVYFTKNGHGICALIDIKELDELDRQISLFRLRGSVRDEDTFSADGLEKELGMEEGTPKKKIKIQYDFSHGPLWKDVFNEVTGEFSTGIEVLDNDKALAILNKEAAKEYATLYSIDTNGKPVDFDEATFNTLKPTLLSLTQAIISRIEFLNDGSFEILDLATEDLSGDSVERFHEMRSRTANTPMEDAEIVTFVENVRKEREKN